MRLKLLPTIAFALTLSACANATEPAPAVGSFVELQHVNYAWGPVYKGYVIDGHGQIFSWDRAGKQWTPSDEDSPTATELDAKYEGKALVRTLPASEVSKLFSLANSAANGTSLHLRSVAPTQARRRSQFGCRRAKVV